MTKDEQIELIKELITMLNRLWNALEEENELVESTCNDTE